MYKYHIMNNIILDDPQTSDSAFLQFINNPSTTKKYVTKGAGGGRGGGGGGGGGARLISYANVNAMDDDDVSYERWEGSKKDRGIMYGIPYTVLFYILFFFLIIIL